ncbi:hypothetical protein Syun_023759 [Stephania yunnanensis]|uniref:SHSP domain-containing protein n=1 Tax=Stephania yunnanensis TaxID=152371 RepID=A0AAP0FHX9_9MAGN
MKFPKRPLIEGKGFNKEELSVGIDDAGRVIVSGKNTKCGHFREVFDVPEDSNMEKISATYSCGILTIKIPKKIVAKVEDSKEEDHKNQANEEDHVEDGKTKGEKNTNEQEEEDRATQANEEDHVEDGKTKDEKNTNEQEEEDRANQTTEEHVEDEKPEEEKNTNEQEDDDEHVEYKKPKEEKNTNEQEEDEGHEVREEMMSNEEESGRADEPQQQQKHVQQDQDQEQEQEQEQKIENNRQRPQEQQPPQPQKASNELEYGDEHAIGLHEEEADKKERTNGVREVVETKKEHDEKIGSEGRILLGKKKWLEGKVGWEAWTREDLDVKVKSAMEKIRKNKATIFTAAVAFSLGFFLCHRLASRSPTCTSSTSSGGEGSCKVDITIIERYLGNPHPNANESKNIGSIRSISLL